MSNKSKKGKGMVATELQQFLANSYSDKKDQKKNINGYVRDDSLSGRRATVYHNPQTGHAVVTHKGTQKIQDWYTDALSAFNLAGNTKRFKHAQKIQNEAAAKYGNDNLLTTGHSLGAKLAEKVGQNSKEVITFNKPTTLENINTRVPKKQTDIRTKTDPVSFLAGTQKNQKNIKTFDAQTWNPLKAHSTDQLGKLGDQIVGQGVAGKKQSKWIEHVKNYMTEHKVSYLEALKLAKATYNK
jgi:hypothetical protein